MFVMLAVRAADASPCVDQLWLVRTGTLAPGARCGRVVVTTEVRARDAATARVELETLARAGDVALRLTVQALSADRVSLELQIPGGYIKLRDGEFGVFTSEDQWALRGWQPWPGRLAGRRLTDGISLDLSIHGEKLVLALDGVAAGSFDLVNRPPKQVLALGVQAPRGRRARVLVSDVQLRVE
jgi:hypothetical protein